MREMRDSGVEWIGEIPKDWNCCKQKYRFTLINGRAFKDNANQLKVWDAKLQGLQNSS